MKAFINYKTIEREGASRGVGNANLCVSSSDWITAPSSRCLSRLPLTAALATDNLSLSLGEKISDFQSCRDTTSLFLFLKFSCLHLSRVFEALLELSLVMDALMGSSKRKLADDIQADPLLPQKRQQRENNLVVADDGEPVACLHDVSFPEGCVPPARTPSSSAEPPAKVFEFTLDPFQSEAIKCLENGESVMVQYFYFPAYACSFSLICFSIPRISFACVFRCLC